MDEQIKDWFLNTDPQDYVKLSSTTWRHSSGMDVESLIDYHSGDINRLALRIDGEVVTLPFKIKTIRHFFIFPEDVIYPECKVYKKYMAIKNYTANYNTRVRNIKLNNFLEENS